MTKSSEHGEYSYVYDDVSRLTNAANPTQPPEAHTYDGVGNRLASVVTSPIVHNENNELLLYGEIAYGYDDNGNLIHKQIGTAAVSYIYDAANRLVKVEDELSSTIIAEYGYDPFGRRLWKEISGTRTYFLYADEGLVAEYDANGNELRSYGYQPDSTWTTDPLWLKQSGQYYWYQNDHLGTPQKLIDRNGTVVWEARYAAFGKAQIIVNTIENNLRFPGQYYDGETGLHYNFHRYYDSQIGRYLQSDPIGFDGGDVNVYGYVRNQPINWIDPKGLKALVCVKKYKTFTSVTIQLPIEYRGPGATEDVITKFNEGIESTWYGSFGDYVVTTEVISEPALLPYCTKHPNIVYVPMDASLLRPGAEADVLGRGGKQGRWPAQASGQTAAHEAGHLMNVGDRYDARIYPFPDGTVEVFCDPKEPEWKDSIMACPSPDRVPLKIDVEDIVKSLDLHIRLFGGCGWVGK